MNIKIYIRGVYKYDSNIKVCIYDKNNCLVSKGCARCGLYCACLKKCRRYKVVVSYLGRKVTNYIYTDKCEFNIFFNMCSGRRNSIGRAITFRLRDLNYDLPIRNGVLNIE